jgi:hypothetical protein
MKPPSAGPDHRHLHHRGAQRHRAGVLGDQRWNCLLRGREQRARETAHAHAEDQVVSIQCPTPPHASNAAAHSITAIAALTTRRRSTRSAKREGIVKATVE